MGWPHCSPAGISEVGAAAHSSLLDPWFRLSSHLDGSPRGLSKHLPQQQSPAWGSSCALSGGGGALSQPPAAPADGLAGLLAPLQQGCWDLLPLPPPRAPLPVLWGLAAAEQGGQHPPLLFRHSRGPWTRCYPMAPEAMVRDALEQAG